jgi:16S rRNA (uracil1498-N3)-methyltransferase
MFSRIQDPLTAPGRQEVLSLDGSRKKVEGRFYIEGDLAHPRVTLPEGESAHAVKSKRLKPGCTVEVFDGLGTYRVGVIEHAAPDGVSIRFEEAPRHEEGSKHRLTLALSPPKRDRMAFAVEKLSELGADALIPTVFRRSLDAGVRVDTSKIVRWRRTAVEAAKQCGRSFLLDVRAPCTLDSLLEKSVHFDLKIVLSTAQHAPPSHAEGAENNLPFTEVLHRLESDPGESLVLVGPEGGFTPEEDHRIREHGFVPASLGKRILRIETAAAAAAAIFRSCSD